MIGDEFVLLQQGVMLVGSVVEFHGRAVPVAPLEADLVEDRFSCRGDIPGSFEINVARNRRDIVIKAVIPSDFDPADMVGYPCHKAGRGPFAFRCFQYLHAGILRGLFGEQEVRKIVLGFHLPTGQLICKPEGPQGAVIPSKYPFDAGIADTERVSLQGGIAGGLRKGVCQKGRQDQYGQ